VIDSQTEAVVQGIVRRESRSLLSYIGDSFPWTTAAGTPALTVLERIVKDEGAAIHALGRFLVRQHVTPPPLGSYPASFTSFNYVALSFLLPRLIDEEQRSIDALKADLVAVADAGAKMALEGLLAVKQRNLAALQGLAAPLPVPA
jgi:hypothetical protein